MYSGAACSGAETCREMLVRGTPNLWFPTHRYQLTILKLNLQVFSFSSISGLIKLFQSYLKLLKSFEPAMLGRQKFYKWSVKQCLMVGCFLPSTQRDPNVQPGLSAFALTKSSQREVLGSAASAGELTRNANYSCAPSSESGPSSLI